MASIHLVLETKYSQQRQYGDFSTDFLTDFMDPESPFLKGNIFQEMQV